MDKSSSPTFVYFSSNTHYSIPLHLVEANSLETVCGRNVERAYLGSVSSGVALGIEGCEYIYFGQNAHWCARCSAKSDYHKAAEALAAAEAVHRISESRRVEEHNMKQENFWQEEDVWGHVEDIVKQQIVDTILEAAADGEKIQVATIIKLVC